MRPSYSEPAIADRPANGRVESDDSSRDRLTVGWRVLAVLQFAAAGFVVFALASRVVFPQGLGKLFWTSPRVIGLGTYSAIYPASSTPSLPSQARIIRPRARAAVKARQSGVWAWWVTNSLNGRIALAAAAPRAPPGRDSQPGW